MALFRRTNEEEALMTEASPAPERGAKSTWIGQHTLVEGKITTREDLCIQGRLKGTVESSAAVLVPEGGLVEADILARNVTIHGRVLGNVEAIEKAEIGKTGILAGGILAATVVVHAGATFEGTVRSRSKPESKPKKNASEDEGAA
jgi:cytoskeletal protein CcmA (bactofilin family)